MNYSENNKIYGRKVIKKNKRKQFVVKSCFFLMGLSIGWILIAGCTHIFGCSRATEVTAAPDGVITEQMLTDKMSTEWTSGAEVDFVPLDVPMDEETQEFIYYLSCGYNIDFPFVMALIETESGFDANAVSATNDCGLMQINKINHGYLTKAVGVTDFLDPHQNVCAGTFMLKNLFEKYNDPERVLMAYNLGEGGASKLWQQGIFETNYSNKVMKKALQYKEQILERKGESNV